MHHSVDGLAIIIGGLGARLWGHTDEVVAKCLAPDIALEAGVRPVGSRRVAASASLAAYIRGHADIILWPCLPPDEALSTPSRLSAASHYPIAVEARSQAELICRIKLRIQHIFYEKQSRSWGVWDVTGVPTILSFSVSVRLSYLGLTGLVAA